ncbi:transposon Tf2-9 polyprotein [Trichonephila clavipes]|nr:transposon Tf2-9 polyprotein [Trichonephila clavipes]
MTSETVEVARIALRLPPFWKSNVRLWIAQCDHAFTFSGISSDDTKYPALVANLDAETLSYVSDIVLSPPNSDKYHTLSQRLITQFSDSETQKIKKLLTDLQLGDEKPSHLLRKMKELSNGQLQDDFLQSLWLQRMPPHIQNSSLCNPFLISKSASHGTVHHIITTGPPVTARTRRLHPKLYDAVKVEFEFLLAQGIIRPSKSPWSSPLHVVPKSDSTVRPVGDYRQLNSVTEFDSYPMP